MNVSAPFILRPIATTLLMVGLGAIGLIAYALLSIAEVPQVDIPTIQVTAQLPGASAETMATSVATPLERQLALISGVASLSSTSSLGQTSITVEFDLGRSVDGAALDVQSAINAAGGQLPKNLPKSADVREDQSSGRAFDVDRAHVERPADLQGGRIRGELCRAADLAHDRRRAR